MFLDIALISFIMGVAIVLILLEIFLLPGITIAGIGGFLFAIGGIIYAYTITPLIGHITLGSSILIFSVIFFWLLRSRSFHKVALHTNVDSKLTSSRDLGIQEGDEGVTISRLAPIGKAIINGITVEAKSQEELIDEHKTVVVVKVDSYNVIVKPKEETNTTN